MNDTSLRVRSAAVALLLAATAIVPMAHPVQALTPTFHVTTGGSDASPGTAGSPWRTLQHAADTVPAGGLVIVGRGTYRGFVVYRSGLVGSPTVIRGATGGAKPIVDGRPDHNVDVIRISGVHDVRIRGFEITGAQGGGFRGAGIRTENGATRIALLGNVIHHNRSFGINSSNSTFVTIQGNDVSHNEVGIQIASAGEGTRVKGNRVHHNDRMVINTAAPGDDSGAVGIGLVKSTGHVLVSGNRVWGNRAISHDYGYDGAAFEIYGARNVTISGNTAWDNENVLETGTDRGGPPCLNNRFVRNVVYGATTWGHSWGMFLRCATNMLIAHDTFVNLDGFVFSIGSDSAKYNGQLDGLRIRDVLVDVNATGAKVFGFMTALPATVTIDHDLLRTSGQLATMPDGRVISTLAQLTSVTGFEAHGRRAGPGFVDANRRDYRLSAGSAAVDAGVSVPGVSDTWKGSRSDIGRYER